MFNNTLLATSGTMIVVIVLITWQIIGHKSQLKTWLGFSALSLELLAAALAIAWASKQGGYTLLTSVFVLGFIGLSLAKATIIKAFTNTQNRKYLFIPILTLLGVYSVVYLAGVLSGNADTEQKSLIFKAENSPVEALESKLLLLNNRLREVELYNNSEKAAEETARIKYLNSEIDTIKQALNRCNPNYITNCILPNNNKMDAVKYEITTLNYSEKYNKRLSLLTEINEVKSELLLLNKSLLNNDFSQESDNKMIAFLLNINTENASKIKWLFFILAFDILSLLLRLSGELSVNKTDENARNLIIISSLLNNGYSWENAQNAVNLLYVNTPENNNNKKQIELEKIPYHEIDISAHEPLENKRIQEDTQSENSCHEIDISAHEMAYNAALNAPINEVTGCLNCGTDIIKKCRTHIFCSRNKKKREDGGNCTDEWHYKTKRNS